jgi:hypothetical protein
VQISYELGADLCRSVQAGKSSREESVFYYHHPTELLMELAVFRDRARTKLADTLTAVRHHNAEQERHEQAPQRCLAGDGTKSRKRLPRPLGIGDRLA